MNEETWIVMSKKNIDPDTIQRINITYELKPNKDFCVFGYSNMCDKNIQEGRMTDWTKLVIFLDLHAIPKKNYGK